jgi:2-keto-4-pentenoate hydratase/2-oxohepta-3-ene-1,7-dioic acid hydratase in catechol pathway
VFRLINANGRSALEVNGEYHDLAAVVGDEAWSDPMFAVSHHGELHGFMTALSDRRPDGSTDAVRLLAPVPAPSQVFGIGLNYRDHALETNQPTPPAPLTFSKFPSCLAGARDEIALSGDHVDWEVELVVVIGTRARHVAEDRAWDHVAGLTLGQDISDRVVQRTGTPPQYSLGKSFAGYGPTGPALVSLDAFDDPDDVAVRCVVSGELMQDSRTSQLIFPVQTLVAYLSSIVELRPGDLIFTGTPAGVGAARGRFLMEGDVIESSADVIGSMRNACVSGRAPFDVSVS